jgi:hypothetical protein
VFPRRHYALVYAWNSGWQSSIKRSPKPSQISFITTSESILIKSRNRCPCSFFHGQSQPIASVCREQDLYWISSIFVKIVGHEHGYGISSPFSCVVSLRHVEVQCSMWLAFLLFLHLSSFYTYFTFIITFYFSSSFMYFISCLFVRILLCSFSFVIQFIYGPYFWGLCAFTCLLSPYLSSFGLAYDSPFSFTFFI